MSPTMTPAEAFAAIPLAAICSDSAFDREETHLLKEQLMHRTPYRNMTALQIGELIEGLLLQFRKDRWEELISRTLPALSPEQQETAFALAVQLVCCDRMVTADEEAFLATLSSRLTLPAGRAAQIRDVFTLLNRDCLAT